MININELEPSQYRGALAAHYTIDNNGIILNQGDWKDKPYWHSWFANWASRPVEESGAEVNGDVYTFYPYEEEIEVFGLSARTKAVHFNTSDLSINVEEFPLDKESQE